MILTIHYETGAKQVLKLGPGFSPYETLSKEKKETGKSKGPIENQLANDIAPGGNYLRAELTK